MSQSRRRLPLSSKRRVAYLAVAAAAFLVVAALVVGSQAFIALAAVVSVILGVLAIACLVGEVLDTRRAAAADVLAVTMDYGRLESVRVAEHLVELSGLQSRLADASATNGALRTENDRLSDRNADLELVLARQSAERAALAAQEARAEAAALPAVIQLPVAPQRDRGDDGRSELRPA